MHNLTKFLVISALIALPMQAIAADAGKGKSKGKAGHSKVDTNADGTISRQEWAANSETKFKGVDLNNDGNVSKEELKAAREKSKAKRDANFAKNKAKAGKK